MCFEVLVDVTQRFVEYEEVWVRYDGSSEEGSLELSAGECSDGIVYVVGEFYVLYGLQCKFVSLLFGEFFVAEESGFDYFVHCKGKLRVYEVFLWQISDCGLLTVVVYGACGGFKESEYDAQQCCFAASVRSGYCNKVAFVYGLVYVLEYLFCSAVHVYVCQCKEWLACWVEFYVYWIGVVAA